MKKILLVAAAASALFAAPAMAQTVTLNGSVAPSCSTAPAGGTVPLGAIANPVGVLIPGAITIPVAASTFPGTFVCNGTAANITLDANPLVGPNLPTGAGAAGFTNTVNYTATISLPGYSSAGVTSIVNLTTAAAAPTTVGLLSSSGSLQLSAATATGTLIAGPYSGTIVVTVQPS